MKKFYLLALATAALFTTKQISAQCNGTRYRDITFAQDSAISNIVYGSNVNMSNAVTSLKLDVHMPKGDTAMHRPLLILIHGGNFLGGSKTGGDVLQFCNDFSRMGYVVASIDYRVGMTNFPFGTPDSVDAAGSVIRAVHDGKAAVRFFKKDFATNGNSYRIDTSNIFVMGVSAGAITALHMAYMDNMGEFPLYADTTNHYGLNGGLEGLSGNPGYSSSFRGVIDICGALGDTSWIAPGNMPAMLFHGDQDQTVPYGSATIYLLGSYPLLEVDGSASVAVRLTNANIEHCFETYEGQDHVPEVSNPAYYDTTLVITRNFLVHYLCGDPLDCSYNFPIGIAEMKALPSLISLSPNPANTEVRIDFSRLATAPASVQLVDYTGRIVSEEKFSGATTMTINTGELPAGLYMVRVLSSEYSYQSPLVVTH